MDAIDDSEAGAALYAPFLRQLPVSGVSITVVSGTGVQSTICTSDVLAARLEELQFRLGEGPTPIALRTWRPVLVPDLAAENGQRDWPTFATAAQETGANGLFALPMFVGTQRVGVVNLYALAPQRAWPALLVKSAQVLAAAAAPPAAGLATRFAIAEPASGRQQTELRRGVHQAAGMVMVQLNGTIDEAMSRIRAYAFSEDRPLDLVARDVVAGVLTFMRSDE